MKNANLFTMKHHIFVTNILIKDQRAVNNRRDRLDSIDTLIRTHERKERRTDHPKITVICNTQKDSKARFHIQKKCHELTEVKFAFGMSEISGKERTNGNTGDRKGGGQRQH